MLGSEGNRMLVANVPLADNAARTATSRPSGTARASGRSSTLLVISRFGSMDDNHHINHPLNAQPEHSPVCHEPPNALTVAGFPLCAGKLKCTPTSLGSERMGAVTAPRARYPP